MLWNIDMIYTFLVNVMPLVVCCVIVIIWAFMLIRYMTNLAELPLYILIDTRLGLHVSFFFPILALPKFEEQPEDMTVFEGERARFPCTINGSPPPTIRWFRNSHPLELDSRMTRLPSGKLLLNIPHQLFLLCAYCIVPLIN